MSTPITGMSLLGIAPDLHRFPREYTVAELRQIFQDQVGRSEHSVYTLAAIRDFLDGLPV